jgi:hypothetical protein
LHAILGVYGGQSYIPDETETLYHGKNGANQEEDANKPGAAAGQDYELKEFPVSRT